MAPSKNSRARRTHLNLALMIRSLSIILLYLPMFVAAFSIDSGRSNTSQLRRNGVHLQRTESRLFSTSKIPNASYNIFNGGTTLSTQQILYPEIYLSEMQPPPLPRDSIPLFAAISSITKSLEAIVDASTAFANGYVAEEQSTLLARLDSTTVLRIEESISAVDAVDPLCWLHAQQSAIRSIRHILSKDDISLPTLYFGDAEGQVEAAVIGKVSNSYSDSWDPFVGKRIWDDESGDDYDDMHRQHSMFKESDLPMGARVYGGSRFDWEFYQEKMKKLDGIDTDDWDGFGGDRGGYWILPAVELRREVVDIAGSFEVNSTKTCSSDTRNITFAVHLHNDRVSDQKSSRQLTHRERWNDAAKQILTILNELSDQLSPAMPCTTLPPIITRSESTGKGESGSGSGDPGYAFEQGVIEALQRITSPDSDGSKSDNSLRKVVLARKVDLGLGATVSGLDVLTRLKFGGHIGHIFYLNPGTDEMKNKPFGEGRVCSREFLGCAPERLFRIKGNGGERKVTTEALAGTRIRGLTPAADAELLHELLSSKKDMLENEITGKFISNALYELESNGWLQQNQGDGLLKTYEFNGISNEMKLNSGQNHQRRFFVRRLRHLQHICQTFEGQLSRNANVIDVSRSLLSSLHPTPAVCGDCPDAAMNFIRQYETLPSYDRGYFAGPFGYIGHESADVIVAIRSGLLTNYKKQCSNDRSDSKISVFAGAGIVEGSTVQGEWTETSHKLGVLSSLFPSSPITLQSYSSPNVAWSTAFVEELVRCGVTMFYICPGSRNTPLTTAIVKTMRSNIGIVRAVSVHDERGAGFRALGYARRNGRAAAVVTSSGTAVANLYPSVVEASSDGVPLILLTADRPYESRDTGSNQSIDQVKIFSSSYVRWFRDIPAPSDDVPVSLALSDANHAVSLSKQLMGPVHLNIQLRENLAPDDGPIRNDGRIGSITKFHNARFTDIPGFTRWSLSGRQWLDAYYPLSSTDSSVMEVIDLVMKSKRGMIVVGNLRSIDGNDELSSIISYFAETIGFPVFASVQSGALRKENPVVPYAEHILKHPVVSQEIQPDLILQLGSPLISTEISAMISRTMKIDSSTNHVLIQQLHPYERADPEHTVTHRVSTSIGPFLKSVLRHIDHFESTPDNFGSELAPLLYLGRELRAKMPSLIRGMPASSDLLTKVTPINGERYNNVITRDSVLTEPQVIQAVIEALAESNSSSTSLFLSNSMPVRDGEFFLYPSDKFQSSNLFPKSVTVNRGASGIDGIISTAIGSSDTFTPTTLICGDVTTLHDLNALYGLTADHSTQSAASNLNRIPLTIVIVNNGGGAIFSFLPIAKHGQDVGFDEYWGTPTNQFSFEKGASAFGLPFKCASSYDSFKDAYRSSIHSGTPTIIEARVTNRSVNVDVHQKITHGAVDIVDKILKKPSSYDKNTKLPIKQYNCEILQSSATKSEESSKTLLLLHGWMGDKTDWDSVASTLIADLSGEWNIVAADLPGHGEAPIVLSSNYQLIQSSLRLDENHSGSTFSLDEMARALCISLIEDHQITSIDAIAGYSLGGRIALAMKRLCTSTEGISGNILLPNLVTDQTRLILIGANPGELSSNNRAATGDKFIAQKDYNLAQSLVLSSFRTFLMPEKQDKLYLRRFLSEWYSAQLWGDLRHRNHTKFQDMISKRLDNLVERRHDIAAVLKGCSPTLTFQYDWRFVNPKRTFFVAGALDKKYSKIGHKWLNMNGISNYVEIPSAGHALLVENPSGIAAIIGAFANNETEMLDNASSTLAFDAATKQSSNTENVDLSPSYTHIIGAIEYEAFDITMTSTVGEKGVLGVGWGENARTTNELKRRQGFVLSITTSDGTAVGVGEVSPLEGLHTETLEDTELQLRILKDFMNGPHTSSFSVNKTFLSLDGSLTDFINRICIDSGINQDAIARSVRSGLEMAILSIASQLCGSTLPKAIAQYYHGLQAAKVGPFELPINGLVTRGMSERNGDTIFPSIKVKIGAKEVLKDAQQLMNVASSFGSRAVKLRGDANREWTMKSALTFAGEMQKLDTSTFNEIEYIEEPLEEQRVDEKWNLEFQVNTLEEFTRDCGLLYALDESLVALAEYHQHDYEGIASELRTTFGKKQNGCAAFVLKPAILGLELSMRVAKLAQQEFQIPVVFSSSFDSGIGLSYTSILAAVTDTSPYAAGLTKYSHGLGTFTMLDGDTLSPPFRSYVSKVGLLNIDSLSLALYGLSLDDMSGHLPMSENLSASKTVSIIAASNSESYLATTSSSTGRDITVSVSMPLPFSDSIASSRFTDLPQMSRWCPWLNSVTYLDAAGLTEWNLNIKGVKFSWKAQSETLTIPKGIKWNSVSGLRNSGVVKFESASSDSCIMKLKMMIIMPQIMVSLFQGMPTIVHDFLQNKLLKWSLEMFRDVVKADLALERGDNQLGDALFGAVEGRANALEEALKS